MKSQYQLPILIEFNWMHRCWKWTQISMLQETLNKQWIINVDLRWEYYRKWSWKSFGDPYSERWAKNWNSDMLISIKSEKIKRELRYTLLKWFPEYLKQKNYNWKWVILLDRWWLWRCMYNFTQWQKTHISDALTIKWLWTYLINILPVSDLYVVLKPSKEVLLNRIISWEENAYYKQRIITTYYELLYQWFEESIEPIKDRVLCISSDDEPEIIHRIIMDEIKNRNIFSNV